MNQPVQSSDAAPPDSGDLADRLSRADQKTARQQQMAEARELRDRLGVALMLDDPAILQADVADQGRLVAQALSRLRAEAEDQALQSHELSLTLPALTAERDRLLVELAQTRAEQDRIRGALTSARDAALVERDRALAERDQAIAERDRALADLTEARDHAAQREAALIASASWRVTAPLRALTRVAGRLGR